MSDDIDVTELWRAIRRGRDAEARLMSTRIGEETRRRLRAEVRARHVAERALVNSLNRLVAKEAYRVARYGEREDFVAAGHEGLSEALRRFDPDKGASFTTYARYWIRKRVFEAAAARYPYDHATVRLLIKYRQMASDAGRDLTASEVARKLKISVSEASHIMSLSDERDDLSLRRALEGSRDSEAEHPDEGWVIDTMKEVLGSQFEDFWMLSGGVTTLDERAQLHGISRQAMHKRYAKMRDTLRHSTFGADLERFWRAL
jgi:RNA polymerase sigma factor (sigma-70 family)